jgi:hypothetical protein
MKGFRTQQSQQVEQTFGADFFGSTPRGKLSAAMSEQKDLKHVLAPVDVHGSVKNHDDDETGIWMVGIDNNNSSSNDIDIEQKAIEK